MTNTKQAAAADDISREAAAELIYRESMLLDQHQWEEWLSLYSTDAVFWMPSWGSESELITDPELELNLIYFKNRDGLEDRVFRGISLLRSARLLGLDEAMKQLSSVRLGACVGLLPGVSVDTLTRLTIQLQSAHLRAADPAIETEEDEKAARARTARMALGEWP